MNRSEIPAYADELIALALEKGAAQAVPFVLSDIAFDERTLMKCMFGCADWGKGPTCPSRPGFPDLPTWRRMLSLYQWGVIVHAHDKPASQRASLALEGRAFRDGYYMAFSLSDCGLCKDCAGNAGAPCRNPQMARPACRLPMLTVGTLKVGVSTTPDDELPATSAAQSMAER